MNIGTIRLPVMLLAASLTAGFFVDSANASMLTGSMTADNAFFAYLSTSDSTLGTLVAHGTDWHTTTTLTNFTLTTGQTYYLHIEAINYGAQGGILGQFSLNDTNFHFSNGSQTLLTDTADWLAIYNDSNNNPNNQQPWVTPTGTVKSLGANGVSPWGHRTGISNSADWIDATTNGLSSCHNCTVDFSASITPTPQSSVPEPATLGLLGSALGAVYLTRMRRRAKGQYIVVIKK